MDCNYMTLKDVCLMLGIKHHVPQKLIKKNILKENVHYVVDRNLHNKYWYFNVDKLDEIMLLLRDNNRRTRVRKTDKKFGVYCY